SATARFAASRASNEEFAQLDYTAEESLKSAERFDSGDFSRWDRAFHEIIWKSANNVYLERQARNAYVLASALRTMDAPRGGDSVHCAQQHIEIAQAVRRRDSHLAGDLADAHVRDVLELVTAESSARGVVDDNRFLDEELN